MKYKTEYNLGDIVLFEIDGKKKVGKIAGIQIIDEIDRRFPIDSYSISELTPLSKSKWAVSGDYIRKGILKKLNKKEFEKVFTKKCVESILEEKNKN